MDQRDRNPKNRQHIIADVRMYETASGGKKTAAYQGWGCPCLTSLDEPRVGYDAWPDIGDEPLLPGTNRRLRFVFLSPSEAVHAMLQAGRFYLWEGRVIGEAKVVTSSLTDDLIRLLKESKIRPDAYNIGSHEDSEVYVLKPCSAGWETFYSERGHKNERRVFMTEAEACRYFYDWICQSSTTRQR